MTWKKKFDSGLVGVKKRAGHLSYDVKTDLEVRDWVLQQRENNLPVTRTTLSEYARKAINKPGFKAAEGLLKQFLQRHDLSLRTRTSVAQNLPEDLKRRKDVFYRHVSILRMETDFEFVVNMDETAVFFDTVPSHTIAKKGAKRVVIRSTGGRETPPDRCPCCNIVWNNTSTARHLQR